MVSISQSMKLTAIVVISSVKKYLNYLIDERLNYKAKKSVDIAVRILFVNDPSPKIYLTR